MSGLLGVYDRACTDCRVFWDVMQERRLSPCRVFYRMGLGGGRGGITIIVGSTLVSCHLGGEGMYEYIICSICVP